MSTIKKLAETLGVSDKTITRHKKKGFVVETDENGAVLIEASVKSFVKFQSEQIRILKSLAKSPKKKNGESRKLKSEPQGIDGWKEEKEKQGAIKLQLQNEKDKGELIPAVAFIELLNPILSLYKSKALNHSNELQKRHQCSPELVRSLDDIARESLTVLAERSADELRALVSQVIERYSKYHNAAEEGADNSMGN